MPIVFADHANKAIGLVGYVADIVRNTATVHQTHAVVNEGIEIEGDRGVYISQTCTFARSADYEPKFNDRFNFPDKSYKLVRFISVDEATHTVEIEPL